jgi:SagB-type dehydrogenase family enzyme
VPCWEGDLLVDLEPATFHHPGVAQARCLLVLTGVWRRSAWRYRDRGYRRVLLDTGHVMGNAVLAAAAEGLRVTPVADFADDAVDGLLLLDPGVEGSLLVAVVEEGGTMNIRAPGRSDVADARSSPEEGGWIPSIHDAARMRWTSAAGPRAGGLPLPEDEVIALEDEPLPGGAPVLEAIRLRRSTRRFRTGTLPEEALGRILAHAFPPFGSPDPLAVIAHGLLDTWVVIADVADFAPGVYRYDVDSHALRPVRALGPRRALYECCLLQELGRDAAATVIHTVDLPRAVARWGERAYRYAHLEAGLIGERLDLAALRLGLGASGIGGFFDDFVNALLGIGPEHAVVYLTTIGLPA